MPLLALCVLQSLNDVAKTNLRIFSAQSCSGPLHNMLKKAPGYMCRWGTAWQGWPYVAWARSIVVIYVHVFTACLLCRSFVPCSEYISADTLRGSTSRGYRHEDLQQTTFASDTFHIVVSTEVRGFCRRQQLDASAVVQLWQGATDGKSACYPHLFPQVFSLVPNPYQALHEMRRILKPGGALVFTVPFAAVRWRREGESKGCSCWLASTSVEEPGHRAAGMRHPIFLPHLPVTHHWLLPSAVECRVTTMMKSAQVCRMERWCITSLHSTLVVSWGWAAREVDGSPCTTSACLTAVLAGALHAGLAPVDPCPPGCPTRRPSAP